MSLVGLLTCPVLEVVLSSKFPHRRQPHQASDAWPPIMSIFKCDSQPKNTCDNMHISVTGSVRNWMSSLSTNTLTGRFYMHTGWCMCIKVLKVMHLVCVFFISWNNVPKHFFNCNATSKSLSPSLPPSLPSIIHPSLLCHCTRPSCHCPTTSERHLYLEGDGEGQRSFKRQGSLKRSPSLKWVLSTLLCHLWAHYIDMYRFTYSHT